MTRHRLATPATDRRGAAAAEFALSASVLFAVLVGIVEMSLLVSRTYTVTRAARDGCRIAAGVIEGVDPTGDEIEDTAVDQARFVLQTAGIECIEADGCEVEASWAEHDGWMMVTVEIDVPYQPFTELLPMLPHSTHGEFTMVTQQQIWY